MNNNLTPITLLKPFTRFIYTLGELPTSYLLSMTYEEQLIWLCNYIEKTVIPALNNTGLAVEELQAKYIELKSYVDNYFDNLDIQEEIDNKLDEMAESGELTDIMVLPNGGVTFHYQCIRVVHILSNRMGQDYRQSKLEMFR